VTTIVQITRSATIGIFQVEVASYLPNSSIPRGEKNRCNA